MKNHIKLIKNISIIIFLLAIIININIVNIVQASVLQYMEDAGSAASYKTSGEELEPTYLVGNIIKTIISLLGIFFIGLTIYGGFLWMNARGDAEQVKKAQNIIRDALIGIVIVIAAYAIAYFVLFYIAKNYITNPGL